MMPETQTLLEPTLRFKEFHGPWEKAEIGDFLEECSTRVSSPTTLPIYTCARSGLKLQAEYYGGRTVTNEGEYGVVPPDSFVFRHMSDDGIFVFHINETGESIAVSKEYPVFRAVGADRHFLLAKLNHSVDFKSFASSQKAGGTRTRLYFNVLRTWKTLLPSLPEQEKIAKCLGSLDHLIGLESRKLLALKRHKSGVIWNLFPQQGGTEPSLRFPKFRSSAAWHVIRLGDLADYENGKAYERDIVEDGRFVVVNAKFISTNGSVRKHTNQSYCIANKGDLLMVLSDLPSSKALARCFWVDLNEKYAVNQRVARITPHSVDSRFLLYALDRHPWLMAFSDGLNQTHLSKGAVLDCPIALPTEESEQHVIGEFIYSIDRQIIAQEEKLVALARYKRGFLDALFPRSEGT